MARIEDTYARDHAQKSLSDMSVRQWGFAAGAAIFLWGLCIWAIDIAFVRGWA